MKRLHTILDTFRWDKPMSTKQSRFLAVMKEKAVDRNEHIYDVIQKASVVYSPNNFTDNEFLQILIQYEIDRTVKVDYAKRVEDYISLIETDGETSTYRKGIYYWYLINETIAPFPTVPPLDSVSVFVGCTVDGEFI